MHVRSDACKQYTYVFLTVKTIETVMETSELLCLLCNSNLEVNACIDIFYTNLPRNRGLLVSFILQVLSCLDTDLRSSYVCSHCYKLLEMLEQAQRTAENIRSEILKVYHSGSCKRKTNDDQFQSKNFDNHQTKTKTVDGNVQKLSDVQDQNFVPNSESVCDAAQLEVKVDTVGYDHASLGKILSEPQRDLKQETVASPAIVLNRREKMAIYTRQCRICAKLFKSEKDLEAHSLKHETRLYQCKDCPERFTNVSSAQTHSVEKHCQVNGNLLCTMESCPNDIGDLVNDDDGIFPEELLGMSDTEGQDDFEWKEVLHTVEKLGSVPDENETRNETTQKMEMPAAPNASKATYKSGRIPKYSLKPLKHPCPTCGKKWRTTAELKTHMKSHSTLRPYMCEKCGQAYKHKHALEVHVGMHNGINPFKCSVCNKCFTQKGALMRHLPMHTGETPYQCELCGKRFVHHTSYNMHALSHTGKKSYQCHVCDLSLLSTSHLKRHMRAHTGERPFSCSLCGKRFAERYNLIAHQKIHDPAEIIAKETKKIQYKCEQCKLLFDKKQKLDEHLNLHHNFGTQSTNKKWEGRSEDMPVQKLYDLQNEISHPAVRDKSMMDQNWQQDNCTKLPITQVDAKLPQNTYQIGTNSLTVALDNHRMLIDVSCNRELIPSVVVASGTQMGGLSERQ